METQEADPRLLTGRGPREDGGEEGVEELDGLAARDEDDDFVVLGKLNEDSLLVQGGGRLGISRQPIRSLQLNRPEPFPDRNGLMKTRPVRGIWSESS